MVERVIRYTRQYSRAELLSDAIVHLVALVAALSAVPVLITLAVMWRGDMSAVAATSVYGATLIAMILCSLLYNHVPRSNWTGVLRRLDHSAIYFKIAGTYTPFAVLSGGAGVTLLASLWGAAVAGTGLTILAPARSLLIGICLSLAMGWAVIVVGWDVLEQVSTPVFGMMLAGGLIYSVGTIFLIVNRMKFHNTIWHVFVMTATVVFFVAIMTHLAQTSPGLAAV